MIGLSDNCRSKWEQPDFCKFRLSLVYTQILSFLFMAAFSVSFCPFGIGTFISASCAMTTLNNQKDVTAKTPEATRFRGFFVLTFQVQIKR